MSSIPPHPNVVRLFGCVLHRPHYALVMEFCGVPPARDGGDALHSLQQLLAEPRAELPWLERLSLATGIAAGMAHLHGARVGPNGRPVVHADLKSANVLLAQAPAGFSRFRLVPKIADFGLSRLRGQVSTTTAAGAAGGGAGLAASAGTRAWMAPELFRGARATEASGARAAGSPSSPLHPATRHPPPTPSCRSFLVQSRADVYAFGVVLFELLSRRLPFAEAEDPLAVPALVCEGRRPVLPLSVVRMGDAPGASRRPQVFATHHRNAARDAQTETAARRRRRRARPLRTRPRRSSTPAWLAAGRRSRARARTSRRWRASCRRHWRGRLRRPGPPQRQASRPGRCENGRTYQGSSLILDKPSRRSEGGRER